MSKDDPPNSSLKSSARSLTTAASYYIVLAGSPVTFGISEFRGRHFLLRTTRSLKYQEKT
jgi:hypothetical protein